VAQGPPYIGAHPGDKVGGGGQKGVGHMISEARGLVCMGGEVWRTVRGGSFCLLALLSEQGGHGAVVAANRRARWWQRQAGSTQETIARHEKEHTDRA
jgi:hypothetical protein